MPAQLTVMVIKTAHPIGRQRHIGIIGLSGLVDGRSGHPPDLDFNRPGNRNVAADTAIAVAFGPAGTGVSLGHGCPRPGGVEPAPLKIKRVPAKAQSMARGDCQHKRAEGNDDTAPPWQTSHAG